MGNKYQCFFLQIYNAIHLLEMKSQTNNRFTLQTENEVNTMESSKLSRASMTSEQRKMYECGMYFPEKVIYTAKLDKKTSHEQWESNSPIKLTSQAFGHIPISSISKLKYYRTSQQKKLTLKITATSQEAFFHVQKDSAIKIFSILSWSKLATMNLFSDIDDIFELEIKGEIFKKSEVLKNWQKRYVTITQQRGLESSKSQSSQPSMRIMNTSQLWTRFETIHQQNYLVIKLWYGIIKQEFAVPIYSALKWIQAFCFLLSQKQ